MKNSLKAFAAATLLAAALVATPMVANAATDEGYPPSSTVNGSVTVAPGGTVTVPFTGFEPNEGVSFTLTGENASGATLAFVKFAVVTADLGTKDADASGAVSATVTLPSNASGDYTLQATGEVSGAADPVILSTGVATGELGATGVDGNALLGLWIGGGALVLAGASIAVAGTVRRQRQRASI
ncbi:hypothetical protein [Microbacterium terricola]|uniref:Sortase n=1 Tax=Microbacterium terricola TaxID=344163 RepID=A0ABM8DVV1_9MICO|nr:hypothetical protein [Microbacterium terricola]UYK39516.1 hypothetical protein OAU46_12525 [Microbacterium terricola]BDV29751.1 hypothetical protein Microterr_04110 [Microbacterium terricola]